MKFEFEAEILLEVVKVEAYVELPVEAPVLFIALSPNETSNEFPIKTVSFALLTTFVALKFPLVFPAV